MTLSKNTRLGLSALAAVGALVLLFRSWSGENQEAKGFFYDLSARRLFDGPIDSIPPIRGVDGPDTDGYRAVVVSISGKPQDRSSWRVAYLERYSPELQAQMERARQGGPPPSLSRSESQAHRWVRRTNDTEWVPIASETGERIVTEWAQPGPDGVAPIVCTP